MAQTRVVILSSQSLFAEGIASRLRQYLKLVELTIVDPRQSDTMAQIAAAQPSVAILDVTDPEVAKTCSLSEVLLSFPELKIIYLDPEQDQIQVVTSERHPGTKLRDVADAIDRGIQSESRRSDLAIGEEKARTEESSASGDDCVAKVNELAEEGKD